eukprot:1397955-Rhodomonas_salina.1
MWRSGAVQLVGAWAVTTRRNRLALLLDRLKGVWESNQPALEASAPESSAAKALLRSEARDWSVQTHDAQRLSLCGVLPSTADADADPRVLDACAALRGQTTAQRVSLAGVSVVAIGGSAEPQESVATAKQKPVAGTGVVFDYFYNPCAPLAPLSLSLLRTHTRSHTRSHSRVLTGSSRLPRPRNRSLSLSPKHSASSGSDTACGFRGVSGAGSGSERSRRAAKRTPPSGSSSTNATAKTSPSSSM